MVFCLLDTNKFAERCRSSLAVVQMFQHLLHDLSRTKVQLVALDLRGVYLLRAI